MHSAPPGLPVPGHPWPGDVLKLRIAGDRRTQIRRQLRSLGIDRAALFPELDGVATALAHRWTMILGDE